MKMEEKGRKRDDDLSAIEELCSKRSLENLSGYSLMERTKKVMQMFPQSDLT